MSETEHFDPTSAEPKTYGDGQFPESLDPPKADELPFSSDREGIEQAIEERSRTAGERNIIDVIQFQDGKGHVQDGNKTASPEYAADELKAYRERKAAVADQQLGEQLAAAVDEFRGVPQEQPEPQPRPDWAPEPQPEYAPAPPTELDNLLQDLPAERRAPFVEAYNQHLQNAQAQAEAQYNQHIAQAQNYAQQYEAGVAQTLLVSEAAAAAPFPELAAAPPEQRQAILAHIGRTNPQRFQEIKAHIAQVKELAGNQIAEAQRIHQYQEAQKQQQQEQTKQQFRQYAEFHDSRVPAVSNLPDVQREIMAMAQEHGIGQQELMQLYETSPVVRHSAFQSMMADAAKYRLAQKATRAALVRSVPQVQKPGTRNEDAVRESEYNNIERELRGKGAYHPRTPPDCSWREEDRDDG